MNESDDGNILPSDHHGQSIKIDTDVQFNISEAFEKKQSYNESHYHKKTRYLSNELSDDFGLN